MPDRAADLGAARCWLKRLLELPQDEGGEPRKVPFSPDARQAMFQLKRWVVHHERAATSRLKSWMGKMPSFALRLATVLHLLRWAAEEPETGEPERIEVADVEAAVRFLKDDAGLMAARAFGEAGVPEGDRDAVAPARWLVANAAHLGGMVNARQLRKDWRALGAGADAKRYDAALAELGQDGFV